MRSLRQAADRATETPLPQRHDPPRAESLSDSDDRHDHDDRTYTRGDLAAFRSARPPRHAHQLSAVFDQAPRGHTERIGQRVDVVERGVALGSLHRADVRAVDPGEIRERLLRELALQAQRPQPAPEGAPAFEELPSTSARHCGGTLGRLLTLRLQPISSVRCWLSVGPAPSERPPRRPRLDAALRFLAIACALGAAVALLSCSGESAEPSLALKVATLDGDAIPDVQGAEERTEVRRIGFLLGAIAPCCGITQDRLAWGGKTSCGPPILMMQTS